MKDAGKSSHLPIIQNLTQIKDNTIWPELLYYLHQKKKKTLVLQSEGAIDGPVISTRITNAIVINYTVMFLLMSLSMEELLPKAAVQINKSSSIPWNFFLSNALPGKLHAIRSSYCPHNKSILLSHQYVLSWTTYQREEWDFSVLIAHPRPGR